MQWFKNLFQKPAGTSAAPTAPIEAPAEAAPPAELLALAAALREEGHDVETRADGLQVAGFRVNAVLHETLPQGENQRCNTQTIVVHPQLGAEPIVEFQFGIGANAHEAMLNGFRVWCQLDFVVLLDAVRDTPETCQYMTWNSANAAEPAMAAANRLPGSYRVLFGPIQHFLADPSRLGEDEDPGFCPCCLFTESLQAFLPRLEQGGILPARLFVARDAEGRPIADCRINGDEYAPVQQALMEWTAKWAERGFEWRKQYVIALPIAGKQDPAAASPQHPSPAASPAA